MLRQKQEAHGEISSDRTSASGPTHFGKNFSKAEARAVGDSNDEDTDTSFSSICDGEEYADDDIQEDAGVVADEPDPPEGM